MGKVIAGMTMSLDGYSNDRNGSVKKLYSDFRKMCGVSSFQEMIENRGAVVMLTVQYVKTLFDNSYTVSCVSSTRVKCFCR